MAPEPKPLRKIERKYQAREQCNITARNTGFNILNTIINFETQITINLLQVSQF